MFTIDKRNTITLTKGDSASMKIAIFDLNNKPYEIKDTDVISLTIKNKNQIVFSKEATEDHFIVFKPEDTSTLSPGIFLYDVQLKTEEDEVYTIVSQSSFILTGEVGV